MKKLLYSFLLLGFGVVVITGCGSSSSNKVVCKYSESDPEIDTTYEEITATLDSDGKVKEISGLIEYRTEDAAKSDFKYAEEYYGESVKLDGKKMFLSNLEKDERYSKIVGKTKDEFIEYIKSISTEPSTIECN